MENLASALAKAQANMKNANLNKINPHFRSRYADLASIRDAAIPALSEQGIALVQAIETREHGIVVITRLLKGEESLSSECPVIVGDRGGMQAFGSALTYAKRYSLSTLVVISADEDDDANAAEEASKKNPPPRRQAAKPPQTASVQVALDKDGNPDWQGFTDWLKAEIRKAPDVGTLNALIKNHNAPISNLKAKHPDLCSTLENCTKNRRNELAQAPIAAE